MLRKMDSLLLNMKSRWEVFADRMLHEEKGAADIVAILVVIVILLGVASLFKTQLQTLVEAIFKKVTEWVTKEG